MGPGNLIHWGSNCSRKGSHDPRASLAFVFRRCGSTPGLSSPKMNLSDFPRRCITDKHSLDADALPSQICTCAEMSRLLRQGSVSMYPWILCEMCHVRVTLKTDLKARLVMVWNSCYSVFSGG